MRLAWFIYVICWAFSQPNFARASDEGLIGYWKLQGDCEDYSGHKNHGTNHGANLQTGEFDGRSAYIEVTDVENLRLGEGDFSIATDVHTDENLTDSFGDLLSKYDPAHRRGVHVSMGVNSSGYNSQSNMRQLFCGLNNESSGKWTDYGRPGGKTHISDALVVFNGELYAGTTDGAAVEDWAHVYRYRDGQGWIDCGRLGKEQTRGVYSMVVHNGELYAATSASHGPQPPEMSFGRVYRYLGGTNWEDIGQPGENYRLNSLASYNGKLYVAGFNIGPAPGHVYAYQSNRAWQECGEFQGWPHPLVVHDGRLITAYPKGEVYAYDGKLWENLGNPLGTLTECNQIHSLGVYRGEFYAGIWPTGKVAVLRAGKWIDLGHLGDATEVVSLATYNGSLYAGTIPRAELFRYDGPGEWFSIRRLFDPPNFQPVLVGSGAKEVQDWTRASSLCVYQGKLFVTTATCYRTMIDELPSDDIRGKVYAFETGECASFDQDLGAGWKHVTTVRHGNQLKLYANGELVTTSEIADKPLDISTNAPLQIGLGPQGHFRGKLREVRLYNRAITNDEVKSLSSTELSKTAQRFK